MRLIDADELEKTLEIGAHLMEGKYGSISESVRGDLRVVQAQPTITPPPNDPLTLEELREMDGEPVWVVDSTHGGRWALVFCYSENKEGPVYLAQNNGARMDASIFLYDGLAYRRRPEEGTT